MRNDETTHKMNEDRHLVDDLTAHRTPVLWPRNQLCTDCDKIFRAPARCSTAHKQSTLQIKESSYMGCHLCSLFYGCLPLVGENSLPSTHVSVDGPWEAQWFPHDQEPNVSDFKIELYVADKRNRSYVLKLEGTRDEGTVNISTHITDFTGSEPTIATAAAWLNECLQKHGSVCHKASPIDGRVVPTRLLRIVDSPHIVQLIANNDPNARYLILSYRWGKKRPGELKLTKTTEQFLHSRVPVDQLPATVRNAVATTKKLGYAFLWVDRLCILQGDDSDWKLEASRMGEYYRNADCCIAALSAIDSHQGLYVNRNPLMVQALNLEHARGWETAWILPSFGRHVPGDYPRLYRGPPYSLSHRAWTLQERLLSPRSLYFGSLMTYWECRRARRAEDIPSKQLDIPFAAVLRKFGSRTDVSTNRLIDGVQSAADEDLFHRPQNETELEKFEERWADLVEFYTTGKMSKPRTDRLVAISGMMSSITKETGQQFVHGLLVSRLTTELLWWQWCDCFGDTTKLPVRTAKECGIPTWSWGSTVGRISPFRSARYLQLHRRSPWRIEATCAVARLEDYSPAAATAMTFDCVCEIDFTSPLLEAHVSGRIDLRHYNWKAEAVAQVGQTVWFLFDAQIWPDEPVSQDMAVWLLRLASLHTNGGHNRPFAGLVIKPLDASQTNGFWKRIGYYEMGPPSRSAAVSERQREQASRTMSKISMRNIKLL